MAEHTPGPWQARTFTVGRKGMVGSESIIADCCPLAKVRPQAEVEANANLIAAAPDLLTSLAEMTKNLLDHASLGLNEEEVSMLKRAEAAIAKATGKAGG